MQLDSETDRGLLLEIISRSTISGEAVLVVAGLVNRLMAATIAEEAETPTTDAKGNTMTDAQRAQIALQK